MAEQAEKKFASITYSGGSPNERATRRIGHHKYQEKGRFVNAMPSDFDGQEGDIVYMANPGNLNKIEQFIKHQGKWINLSQGQETQISPKRKKWVQARVK